ncbi:endoribonuclease YicC domain-containing protein [Candidatus Ichthyocystis sparus]|nr:DUF1732 domain-containing protein [Candidatus Ichthyocystis sparus]
MTGYGNATINTSHTTIELALKSVNSRTLDIHFKLPEELQHLEPEMRKMAKAKLSRGKVEIRAHCIWDLCSTQQHIKDTNSSLSAIQTKYSLIKKNIPDIQSPSIEWVVKEWHSRQKNVNQYQQEILDCFGVALDSLDESRQEEGKGISSFLYASCMDLSKKLMDLSSLLRKELESSHRKLLGHWKDLNIDPEINIIKTEQENYIISNWLAKFDVDEEIGRLTSHIMVLTEIIGNPPKSVGKKVEFFIQEMGREANTLLSKSLTGNTAIIAIDIKVIIEKMKEQAQNVE